MIIHALKNSRWRLLNLPVLKPGLATEYAMFSNDMFIALVRGRFSNALFSCILENDA